MQQQRPFMKVHRGISAALASAFALLFVYAAFERATGTGYRPERLMWLSGSSFLLQLSSLAQRKSGTLFYVLLFVSVIGIAVSTQVSR